MFRFAFDGDDSSETGCQADKPDLDQLTRPKQAWFVAAPANLRSYSNESDGSRDYDVVELADGAIRLFKTSRCVVPEKLAPESADLIPGKYEGGYKLWEGATDLLCYIHRDLKSSLSNRVVLELGAGHALPSIYALKAGAKRADIADFNEDVLRDVTANNVVLNCGTRALDNVQFIAGDWSGIPLLLNEATYDFVFAAEVAYSVESIERLAACILRMLKPGGIALIAGKTYYFGVGGGMRALEQSLRSYARHRMIDIVTEVAAEFRDGKSNVREILSVLRAQK